MNREYVDLAVIIPLEEELIEFMKIFPHSVNRSTDTELRYFVETGNSNINILVVQQQGMGKTHAIKATTGVLRDYDVGLFVCLGIAASLSDDVHVGDVCYTGTLIDALDNAKAVDSDEGAVEMQLSSTPYTTPLEITSAFNFIRTMPELRPGYDKWRSSQKALGDELIQQPFPGRSDTSETLQVPRSHNGSIVCGSVSQSSAYNKRLKGLDRKLLAVETESGGVFDVATANRKPAIAIRGISDYAVGKGDLETCTDGAIRQLAALNAATFLKAQLENHTFLKAISVLRQQAGGSEQVALPFAIGSSSGLAETILEIGNDVDDKLRQLSPEFRLQPAGYRLPLPRIRAIASEGGLGGQVTGDPMEIREGLSLGKVMLLTVPRTYPDQSLPWVIASDLLTAEIDGKQAVPIIVDGEDIAPPKSGLSAHATRPLQSVEDIEGACPVIILENPPFQSKTRTRFLIQEIRAHENCRIIILMKSDTNFVMENEVITSLSANAYSICDVSFSEIAHFLEKNFCMSGSEAEAVALRLKKTFSDFELSAHPTYFAGIPRETLSALLQANRRAELIQLAVDGFLTFVVAEDTADVNLSRTTRFRFLQKLAAAVRLEKRNFDHSELMAFVMKFAVEFDYDINPVSFIHAFEEKGILHFDGGHVRISLPFIESYVLATELREREDEALRYFSVDEADFDNLTFDIYAELGASQLVISMIMDRLEEAVKKFPPPTDTDHFLFSNEIATPLLMRPEKVEAFQKRVRGAIDDVKQGKTDSKEKQRLLDVADRVRDTTAKHTETFRAEGEDGARDRKVEEAIHVWGVGAILLGSGAERLSAEVKRKLAKLLIDFATFMVDDWTRFAASIPFDEMKRDLTSEEAISSFKQANDSKADVKDLKRLIEDLVDVMQITILQMPFRRTIEYLCEQAHSRVLLKSIESVDVSEKVKSIILGTWLADIDSHRGKDALRSAVKNLPDALFLRVTLAVQLLSRVYWNHGKKEDRLTLLDAADEALKPLQLSVNKPELQRLIARTSDVPSDASGEVTTEH